MDNNDDNYVFVEYLSNVNNVVKQTFKSMQRIKLICIDSSVNFLLFGATSGGVYIFKREPCEFVKLIPSKEGSAHLIAVSPDERHLGIATSKGLILILENFIEDSSLQYQIFSEHEGTLITSIKWHRNELYVGDECGKVSVVSAVAALFQSKSIFQIPSASLMTLDSCIVQIDTYLSYLLVSTRTRTYLCNTANEHYIQIGKKLRDGYFGACFCNTSNDLDINNTSQNTKSAFRTIKENEIIITEANVSNTKIYCARPGARLWEAGFDAKVLVTYQFRSSLQDKPKCLLVIGCEEEATLEEKVFHENKKVPADNFNFQKVFPICDRFVLTHDTDGLYIFDPVQSKLVFWIAFSSSIKDISFVNNTFYIWKNNLEINVFSVLELEHLILSTLYKKQYYLCAELCVKFSLEVMRLVEESKKLYLISVLKNKIGCGELLDQLSPVLDKVKQVNERILTRQSKGSIVVVDNLYLKNEEVNIPPVKMIPDEKADLKLVLKQYKLNKTHRTVEIPEVIHYLQTLNADGLFLLFKRFADYVLNEFDENATPWCQEQYLKQISKKNSPVKDLPDDEFDFLTDALIEANDTINYSCSCGYPLPKCHRHPPNFYKTALDIFNLKRGFNKLKENIPYLWRYRVHSEIHGLNMTVLIQFSDLGLLKEHMMGLKYDNWHDVLGYFVKLNKGMCLNCDRKIDIEGILSWTELAKVIVQSMGATNTLKILEKYEKFIPNGALDPTFYQSCIFTHSFNNSDNIEKVKPETSFKFISGMDEMIYNQFQETLENYFKRKNDPNRSCSYIFQLDNTGTCFLCNLPLKNDILFDYENATGCGHRFHKFCYHRNNNVCNVCD